MNQDDGIYLSRTTTGRRAWRRRLVRSFCAAAFVLVSAAAIGCELDTDAEGVAPSTGAAADTDAADESASDDGTASLPGNEASGDVLCELGIENAAGTVCCDAACGTCGGSGCGRRPGGVSACCTGPILESGVSCEDAEAPCSLAVPGDSGDDGDADVCALDVPVPGLPPFDFTMHNVLTKTMQRADFCDARAWYDERLENGQPVQEFRLNQGDDFSANVPGGRQHARVEFEGGFLVRGAEGVFREIEMRMLVNKRPENTITLGQIFGGAGGDSGPDARIEIRPSGEIRVGSLKGRTSNVKLSPGDESYVGRSFKVKLRTDGRRVEIFFNGERKHEGPTRNPNGTYHFRWGLYSNDIPQDDRPLTNTVSELVVR